MNQANSLTLKKGGIFIEDLRPLMTKAWNVFCACFITIKKTTPKGIAFLIVIDD
ncbi:hypothetical protein [Peribacillus butanolivorans]